MRRYEAWVEANLDVAQRAGDEWVTRCPYPENHKHGDSTPSFSVNVEKGVYLCFACGARGHLQALAKKLHAPLGTQDVASAVVNKIRAVKEERSQTEVEGTNIYPEAWLSQFANPTDYWSKRGFDADVQARWGLGYDALRNAVTIPLRSLDREVIGVIRRRLGNEKPRYLYPRNFRRNRYVWGAWEVREGPPILCVTEGAINAIAMWEAGYPAVAVLGSMLTEAQARVIRGVMGRGGTVVGLFDNDQAGRGTPADPAKKKKASGTYTLGEHLRGLRLRVGWDYGVANDVADLSKEDRKKLVKTSAPYSQWVRAHDGY